MPHRGTANTSVMKALKKYFNSKRQNRLSCFLDILLHESTVNWPYVSWKPLLAWLYQNYKVSPQRVPEVQSQSPVMSSVLLMIRFRCALLLKFENTKM